MYMCRLSWTMQTCSTITSLNASLPHCHPYVAPLSLLNIWNCLRQAQKICYVQRRRLYKCLRRSIDISKASGPDQISGRILKFTTASIAAPVTKLFNQSISTGCFPVTWKQSNIAPIPKSTTDQSLCFQY